MLLQVFTRSFYWDGLSAQSLWFCSVQPRLKCKNVNEVLQHQATPWRMKHFWLASHVFSTFQGYVPSCKPLFKTSRTVDATLLCSEHGSLAVSLKLLGDASLLSRYEDKIRKISTLITGHKRKFTVCNISIITNRLSVFDCCDIWNHAAK